MKPLRIVLLCALAGLSCSDQESFERPALVVVISLDTLRADRLELYGYERETSPNLTALARDASVFRTALAQAAQTLVSHKSIFTGKTPLRLLRERTNADLAGLRSVPEPYPFLVNSLLGVEATLAQELRQAGYRTAAFTDGAWMRKGLGFEPGFDVYDDEAAGAGLKQILPKAYRWIESGDERDAFLFLHTYDVHCPYVAREPYDTKFCSDHRGHLSLDELCPKTDLHRMQLADADRQAIRDHYDGGIANADARVGELLEWMRRAGRYDEALIIVTSDHGEGLGDHGQFGHGGLYLEQLLVPLIVKFPKHWEVPTGMIEQSVELVDLLPTVFEACGVPLPDDIDGRSLFPTILGTEPGRRYLVAQTTFREWAGSDTVTNLTKRAVLQPGRWFLIHDSQAGTVETYSLAGDPDCQTDVFDTRPGSVVDLLRVLEARDLGQVEAAFQAPQHRELSDEMKRQLEKLGY